MERDNGSRHSGLHPFVIPEAATAAVRDDSRKGSSLPEIALAIVREAVGRPRLSPR